MAFTEKDMQAQEEQLSTLKDELSRLNQKFDAQLKGMGLTEDDLKQQEEMTPEVEALVAKAKEEAKRAGEARKAQASLDNRPSGKAPGAGRRGASGHHRFRPVGGGGGGPGSHPDAGRRVFHPDGDDPRRPGGLP